MRRLILSAFLLVLTVSEAFSQAAHVPLTSARAGINFFSPQQDIDIGNEAAHAAAKQLPLVRDARINQYVQAIAQRILDSSAVNRNRFLFHVVNSPEVQSVALPNGAIYLYRGLLALTSNDAQLAALIAHEISHIQYRHATAQLSRQLLVQAPTSLSTGFPMSEGWKDGLVKLGVVFGVNAPFLHYSPEQESEASAMTAKLLPIPVPG